MEDSALRCCVAQQGVFNLTALVVSFIGAVILLAVVNLVRRGRVR